MCAAMDCSLVAGHCNCFVGVFIIVVAVVVDGFVNNNWCNLVCGMV